MATAPEAPPSDLELAKLSAYLKNIEILELLGRGGMGFVYKARQPSLNRFVALKILSRSLASDGDFAARFAREAQALARLNHPNIVGIYDFGQEAGFHYFVMEYVEGANLRTLLRSGALTGDEILGLVSQLCDALAYAHSEGVVHRDIKPENLLVDLRGRLKVVDFGLSKLVKGEASELNLTSAGWVLGTQNYMAPEQRTGKGEIDHRADLYAAGVILYELLTGELPVGAFPPLAKCRRDFARLDPVVRRALEREPERRYQSAKEIATDVGRASGAGAPRFGRRAAIAGLGGVVILGGLLTWRFWGSGETPKPPAPSPAPPPPPSRLEHAVERWSVDDGVAVEGGTLRFEPHNRVQEARAEGVRLPGRCILRFEVRYEIEPGQEPWILVKAGDAALMIFAEGDHSCAFAKMQEGRGWAMMLQQPLPAEVLRAGRWWPVEVSWNETTRSLRLVIDGKESFDARLPEGERFQGAWGFAVGGKARFVEVRGAKVEPKDRD